MLVVAGLLLLNATAPVLDESGGVDPLTAVLAEAEVLADLEPMAAEVPSPDAVGDSAPPLADDGATPASAAGPPDSGQPEPADPGVHSDPEGARVPALPDAKPVMPYNPGVHVALPCLQVMGDTASVGVCPNTVVNAVLRERPAPPEPDVANPSPVAAESVPAQPLQRTEGVQALHAGSPSFIGPQPSPGPTPHVAPAGDALDPGVDPRSELGSSVLAWIGATAAAVAPTLILLKLLASLAIRRRRRTSPRRDALIALIAGDPGIHHTELVRQSGFGNGAVQHHLRSLLEEGLVTRVRTAGHACFFPAHGIDPAVAALRTAARSPATRQVLTLLAARPRTLSALAEETGLPVTTVHYHVAKLVRSGALARDPAAGRALALTPLARRAFPTSPSPA